MLCQLYLNKKEKGKFAKADADIAHLGVWLFGLLRRYTGEAFTDFSCRPKQQGTARAQVLVRRQQQQHQGRAGAGGQARSSRTRPYAEVMGAAHWGGGLTRGTAKPPHGMTGLNCAAASSQSTL